MTLLPRPRLLPCLLPRLLLSPLLLLRLLLLLLLLTLSPAPSPAQAIPSGYVQTTATVPSLANGSFGAAWTNLSTSPQLALLGCVSTFQQTVNGSFNSYGTFTTLLADTAQICPSPSTWTFTFTFACPAGTPASAFQLQIPITGGGGTENITSQISAALPAKPCGGGGGSGIVNPGLAGQLAYYATSGTTVSGENLSPSLLAGALTCIGSSGNGAAYSCTPPSPPSATPFMVVFYPDVNSQAGATLTVSGYSGTINPPLTTNQWIGNNLGVTNNTGYLLLYEPGETGGTFQIVNAPPAYNADIYSCINQGTAGTLACSPTPSGFTLTPGVTVALTTPVTNSADPTLNVLGTGALAMVNQSLTPLTADYIAPNSPFLFTYDNSGPGYWVTAGAPSVLPIWGGGTGASTAVGALNNLGASPVVYYNILSYGGQGDFKTIQTGCSLAGASNILTCSSGPFLPTDASGQKYAVCEDWSSAPFSTSPYSATITGYISATQVTLSRPAANSTSCILGYGTDNFSAYYLAQAAAQANGGGIIFLPAANGVASNYGFNQANYVLGGYTLDGSMGNSAGGSGAVIVPTLSGGTSGSITGWTVTAGGSDYTPSSSLQVAIGQVSGQSGCPYGYDNGPCGYAYALANTNSSGQVISVTNTYGGYGFTSVPSAAVIPLSGDGATFSGSVSGGAIAASVNFGGGGYLPSSTIPVYAICSGTTAGGVCTANSCNILGGSGINTQYEIAIGSAVTNSSGQATGAVTWSTPSTGCLSLPTLITGSAAFNSGTASSPNWVQAHNITPVPPIQLPVHMVLAAGVGVDGAGLAGATATGIDSNWDGLTVDLNSPALFGGIFQASDLGSFGTGTCFAGLYLPFNANSGKVHDWIDNCGWGGWIQATDIGYQEDNLTQYGYASTVIGGTYSTRYDVPSESGGFNDMIQGGNREYREAPYGGSGSISQKLDDFFANNWWRPQDSAASTDFAETCKFPQASSQTQLGHVFYQVQQGNSICYPGISSQGYLYLPRASRLAGTGWFNQVVVKSQSRYAVCCDIGGQTFQTVNAEAQTPLTGSSDPYRNAATLEGAMKFWGGQSSAGGTQAMLNVVSWSSNTNIAQCLWSLQGGASTAGTPLTTIWSNAVCSNVNTAIPAQNPSFQVPINFYQGINIQASDGNNYGANFFAWQGNTSTYEGRIQGVAGGGLVSSANLSAPGFTDTGLTNQPCIGTDSSGNFQAGGAGCTVGATAAGQLQNSTGASAATWTSAIALGIANSVQGKITLNGNGSGSSGLLAICPSGTLVTCGQITASNPGILNLGNITTATINGGTNILASDATTHILDVGASLVKSYQAFSATALDIGANTVIPSWVTGYNGNSSGIDLPLSLAWGSPSSLVLVCHDTNGNLTDTGCPGTPSFSMVVGTTPVVSGTSGKVLDDNGGILGQLAVAGSGAGLTTGPASGVTSLDVAEFTGTGGQLADSSVAVANLTQTTSTPAANQACIFTGTSKTCTPEAVPNAALANQSTTVNGQTCTLGSTCSITASAAAIQVGVTTVTSGSSNAILFDNAGILGNVAPTDNAVLVTNGTGAPSESTTLPGSLTIPSPALSGTVSGANTIPLSILAQVGADTVLGNSTGSTANVTAAYAVGTAASDLVQLNGSAQLPALNGSLLTNLNGSNIASGTVPGSYLAAINLAGTGNGGVTGQLPIGDVGSSGLSGTSPINIASSGAISCPTCNTSSAVAITLQTNSSNNPSQSLLNFETSTANAVGLTATPVSSSGGIEKIEITGNTYSGNAATASGVETTGCSETAYYLTGVNSSSSGDQSLYIDYAGGGSYEAYFNCSSGLLYGTWVDGQKVGPIYQVDQFSGSTLDAKWNNCIIASINAGGGICDARNETGAQSIIGQMDVNGTHFNISHFSVSGSTLTFTTTAAQPIPLVAGNIVNLYGFTSGNTGLNGQSVTVLSAGLSTTTFEATVTGSGYSSGSGAGSLSAPAGVGVTVLLPNSGSWVANITDGISCAIRVFNAGSIIGDAVAVGSALTLTPYNSSVNMDGLICNDPDYHQSGAFVRIEPGIYSYNTVGATFASGLVHIQNLYDESYVGYIQARNDNGVGFLVSDVGCGSEFDHINSGSYQSTASYALHIESNTSGANLGGGCINGNSKFSNSTFGGYSSTIIDVDSGVQNTAFDNIYMEKYHSDSTPMVSVASTAGNIAFTHAFLTNNGSGAEIGFKNASQQFSVADSYVQPGSAYAIQDTYYGINYPASTGEVSLYRATISYSPSIILAAQTNALTIIGGTHIWYHCSGGTLDGALVAGSSTQATACTGGGGSLITTNITTP